jgi:Arc/MetJ-type ribon-helix-helix transcriptional regulator
MANKTQVSVRLDPMHLRELRDLEPHFGNNASEVARTLLVQMLEQKHGLDRLREKRAIR